LGGILFLLYVTRLASKEIFSPTNKIHWEVGRAKDLSAPLYEFYIHLVLRFSTAFTSTDHSRVSDPVKRALCSIQIVFLLTHRKLKLNYVVKGSVRTAQ